MSISERLIKKRKELDFTQAELATRAGLKPPAISQYESGVRSPSYDALIKLSNALNVTTDYLISGNEDLNPNNLFLKIIENMTIEQKDKLLDYATYLINSCSNSNSIPMLNNSVEYANYVITKIYKKFPVDVYEVANLFNISIYTQNTNSEFEGAFINGERKFIILNDKIDNEYRKKFTIATLIGHSLIPWHLKFQYRVRKSGTSTLQTCDIEEIEAQSFASNLIIPADYIEKDLTKDNSIKNLKRIAYEKYKVSLTVLLKRLVDINKNKYAVAYSDDWNITRTIPCSRPLVDKISPDTYASSFITNPSISEKEVIRDGCVPAEKWFIDAHSDEIVYEQSIYNPEYAGIMTFLTIVS